MTKTFLGCIATLCVACGGNVDLGGAGGGKSTGGASSGGAGGVGKGGGSTGAVSGGGGAGGSGGSAGNPAGGSGGTPPVACGKLIRTGDPIQVSNNDEAAWPTLVRTGSGAAVVYRHPSPGPSPGYELV